LPKAQPSKPAAAVAASNAGKPHAAKDLFDDKPVAAKAPSGPASGLFGVPAKAPAAPQANATGGADGKKSKGLFGVAGQAAAATAASVTLSSPLPAGSPEADAATRQSLADRLVKTGLARHEVEWFVSSYAPLVFESDELVVACRLEGSVIEEQMSLSIFPVPETIVRVPILVVRHADPQLKSEVEQLIARLGDADYAAREAAQKRLIALGPLAFEALRKALQHEDMEIVIRAERILLSQDQKAAGRQGTGSASAGPAAQAAPVAPAAAAGKAILQRLFNK
jgi:hypothetical protein